MTYVLFCSSIQKTKQSLGMECIFYVRVLVGPRPIYFMNGIGLAYICNTQKIVK